MEFLITKLGELESLTVTAVGAVALIGILVTLVKSKFSLVPTLVAFIGAGLVIWGINNVSWFADRVDDETRDAAVPVIVVAGEWGA